MIFLLLCMVSVIEVYSASSRMTFGNAHYWEPIIQHGSFVAFGILTAWIVQRIPCNYFKLGGTVILHLLAYPLLFWALLSAKTNDASRWVDMGFVKMQPSEIAKVCLVVFVAFMLATFRDENGPKKNAIKIVFCEVVAVIGLIVSENASTAGIIFLVMFGMAIIAQVKTKILCYIGAPVIAGLALGATLVFTIPDKTLNDWEGSEIKMLHRVPTWIHRIKDHTTLPNDPNDYKIAGKEQVTHARIAIASCNIIGKGPGNSVQRDFLPQAFSDFIYAIIIEEMGIVGAAGVMFLYLLLMWRAMKIAERCKALFPAYLVLGLALMMVIQAMINMAVAVGAFPVTGQPLPLISRGGTSIFVNCAYIGMILSVSRSAKKRDDVKALPEEIIA